jgi:probable HAF family extracellular repeat protein
MTDLGTLGGNLSFGLAINDAGQVVGQSLVGNTDEYNAFLYSNGTMFDLGTLGGDNSYAEAINASGEIAGYSDTADGSDLAFIDQNGVMTSLGTLPGATYSYATAINDSGEVVGQTDLGAFLYDGTTMINLNDYLAGSDFVSLYGASAINDNGQIVGTGITIDGNEDAFLLTPTDLPNATPEPSTLLLFGIGLIGIARRLRRSR